jgi:kynurenine formamidase
MTRDEYVDLVERLRASAPHQRDPQAIKEASDLVREGLVVSCGDGPAMPGIDEQVDAGSPHPYRLQQWYDEGDGWAAVNDRLDLDIHGATSMTHIDTVNHFFLGGRGFDKTIAPDLSVEALTEEALRPLIGGIVGRGILLDFPSVLGGPVQPGHAVTTEELQRCLAAERVAPKPGDILLLRFGRSGTRDSGTALGAAGSPGLSIECAEWMAATAPCAVVTDHGMDVLPGQVEGTPAWHILLLVGLGVPLVDAANLEELAATCARLDRHEFFCTIAPLDIPHASGSPVNPLAIF